MKELYLDRKLFTGSEEEFISTKAFHVKTWYQNGKIHREDGPAVIYSGGGKCWRIDGVEFSYFFNGFFPMKKYAKNKFPGE